MSNVQYIKLTFTVISLCGCAFSVVQWPILRIQTITRFFLIIVLFITMAIFTSKQKTSLCQITTAKVLVFIICSSHYSFDLFGIAPNSQTYITKSSKNERPVSSRQTREHCFFSHGVTRQVKEKSKMNNTSPAVVDLGPAETAPRACREH